VAAQATRIPESRPGVGTVNGQVLRIAEWLIARACRRLPEDVRDERYREWTAELPEILHDPKVRFAPRRAVATLLFAADQSRGTLPLRDRAGAFIVRFASTLAFASVGILVGGVVGGVGGVFVSVFVSVFVAFFVVFFGTSIVGIVGIALRRIRGGGA